MLTQKERVYDFVIWKSQATKKECQNYFGNLFNSLIDSDSVSRHLRSLNHEKRLSKMPNGKYTKYDEKYDKKKQKQQLLNV